MVSKGLVVAVIILFVGVGIQPAFAVNLSNTSISDDENDCDICPKISKQNIDRLGSLINKVETIDNKLLSLSKYYLKVEEKCKELSDKITPLLEIKDIYLSSISWPFPFLTAFCAVALALWAVYFSILNFFIYEVLNKLAPYIGIQGWILGLMIVETILLPLMIPLYPTLFICGFYDPGPP